LAILNTVMKLLNSQKTRNSLSSWATISFSIIIPKIFHGVYLLLLLLLLFSLAYQNYDFGNWQWRYSCHFLTMNASRKQINVNQFLPLFEDSPCNSQVRYGLLIREEQDT
jgi:hypothetical protein